MKIAFVQDVNTFSVPIGTAIIAGVLRDKGHEVDLFVDEDKIDIDMSDVDLNDDQDNKNSLFSKQLCNGNKETKDYDQDTVYSIPVVQGVP